MFNAKLFSTVLTFQIRIVQRTRQVELKRPLVPNSNDKKRVTLEYLEQLNNMPSNWMLVGECNSTLNVLTYKINVNAHIP